jgi:hypothetical protein
MDPKPSVGLLLAPSALSSVGVAHFPGTRSKPLLDEHVVVPETTRDELVRGRRVIAQPSAPPHGDRHFELDYVIRGSIRPGYIGSTDMITRFSADSDFATDTSVRKAGIDPATGQRYLEELAFEVVHTQSKRDMIERAEDLTARGVRRLIGIFVKEGVVREWVPGEGAFRVLPPGSSIEDPCLSLPIRVESLLSAAEADNAVARALLAKQNPVLVAVEAQGKERGIAQGRAEAVLTLLASRGIPVSPAARAEILACSDLARLDQWLIKSVSATAADDLLEPP